jgi:pyridoxamine 5'-phosphate oxidase
MSIFPADYIPSPDPFVEFDIWIQKALASGEKEPTSMTLSTVSRDQRPRGRIVLYKGMSQNALTFFTNYESNKGLELELHAYAALTFHWKSLELQLRVEGKTSKTTRQESEKYFATRARESQIGAWVSQQSRMLKSKKDLETKKKEVEEKFKDQDIVCPPFWGGYRVVPDFFEFWIAGTGRLHDRFQFSLDKKAGWLMTRLYP